MTQAAWLGLGVMGYPMAGYLSRYENIELTVFNRTLQKAEKWCSLYKGQKADTPIEAARDADFVFCCVGNDNDLRNVALGPSGAFQAMKPGSVFVDHTTTSAEVARELADKAQKYQISFIDAPVSGGQAGAENGTLTVMAGGEAQAFHRALPLIQCYSRSIKHIGPSGAGQLTKMVNQICIAGVVQGLAEALHFAQKAGLPIADVIETISKGAAQSWQMDNRWQTMSENKFDFGFAVDWMRKDLGFCLQEARKNGAHLPLTALVDQFYSEVQAMGGGRWDTSSLVSRLNTHSNIERK